MPLRPHVTHRSTLRPRAGLAATVLLLAGLAGSAGVVVLGARFVEPARAESDASRIDRPMAESDAARIPARDRISAASGPQADTASAPGSPRDGG